MKLEQTAIALAVVAIVLAGYSLYVAQQAVTIANLSVSTTAKVQESQSLIQSNMNTSMTEVRDNQSQTLQMLDELYLNQALLAETIGIVVDDEEVELPPAPESSSLSPR